MLQELQPDSRLSAVAYANDWCASLIGLKFLVKNTTNESVGSSAVRHEAGEMIDVAWCECACPALDFLSTALH